MYAIVPSNESLFAEMRTEAQDIEQIKAAIMLPFILKEDSISSETQKMVEFYEGFLLALDSLKKEGVSVDVHVYDTGNEWQSIMPILEQPEMKEMNLIIGPVYKKHIDEAASFANTNGIRLVLPFERKVDQVFNNPYIYQINTPQSYFYSEVYDHFFTQFQHPNVILFQSEGEKEDGMIAGFKQELESRQVPYTVLVADTATNKDTIRAYLDVQRENILMMTSEKVGGLNNIKWALLSMQLWSLNL